MLSHENFTSALTGIDKQDIKFLKTDVHLSYLPLPHVMERLVVVAMMYKGACICFYRGDTTKLKDDLAIVRPTIFVSVPRLFGRFYEGIKSNIAKLQGCKASLAKSAQNSKLEKVLKTGVPTHGLWDALVF
jgi:long-chain acyl-CoA synthetase